MTLVLACFLKQNRFVETIFDIDSGEKGKGKGRAWHEIAPNTGTNVTKSFTLATKSRKLVARLATRMFHHNLT